MDMIVKMPYTRINKWCSEEEQLVSNVGLQSTLSSSLLSVIFMRIRVGITNTFFGGFGTGNSSLCGTGIIADGKSVYCTACLGFELIPLMFVHQK
jgi:hypothetical protein